MRQNELRTHWMNIKDRVHQTWSDLSEEELNAINGDYNRLVDAIQTRYGYQASEAQTSVDDFLNGVEATVGDVDARTESAEHLQHLKPHS